MRTTVRTIIGGNLLFNKIVKTANVSAAPLELYASMIQGQKIKLAMNATSLNDDMISNATLKVQSVS